MKSSAKSKNSNARLRRQDRRLSSIRGKKMTPGLIKEENAIEIEGLEAKPLLVQVFLD